MSSLLEVHDLGVVYKGRGRRKDKVALDGVTVRIGAGETLGLVGESGSGKSTLGACVLGLVQPRRGWIVFDGRDITSITPRARRELSTQIQAVFQDPYTSFNPHRTIEQSVGETLISRTDLTRADRRDRIVAMLERVGLDSAALAKFPSQFSGGQRQRIAIARALLPNPRLVVCDESVSALDLSVQAQVLNLLLELQRELTVSYLFITHDLSVVRHMSTRIAVLEHGRLVEDGPAEDVSERPTQPYTRRLIAASPQADPDIQDARRRTRQVISRLHRDPSEASRSTHDMLRALELQAVVELLAQPRRDLSGLIEAFARFDHDRQDISRLIELRAAIPQLVTRTSAALIPERVLSWTTTARASLCQQIVADDRIDDFVTRCQVLATALAAGSRADALAAVSSLDEPRAADVPAETTRSS